MSAGQGFGADRDDLPDLILMSELFGTMDGLLTQKLFELGVHLHLIGAAALFLGSLRFVLAGRTVGRLLLVAGCGLFALGVGIESLELLGLYEQSYYPGWKPEEFRILEAGGDVIEVPTPTWWEALLWWLARLARVGGLLGATAGCVMEGRGMLRGGAVGSRRART